MPSGNHISRYTKAIRVATLPDGVMSRFTERIEYIDEVESVIAELSKFDDENETLFPKELLNTVRSLMLSKNPTQAKTLLPAAFNLPDYQNDQREVEYYKLEVSSDGKTLTPERVSSEGVTNYRGARKLFIFGIDAGEEDYLKN